MKEDREGSELMDLNGHQGVMYSQVTIAASLDPVVLSLTRPQLNGHDQCRGQPSPHPPNCTLPHPLWTPVDPSRPQSLRVATLRARLPESVDSHRLFSLLETKEKLDRGPSLVEITGLISVGTPRVSPGVPWFLAPVEDRRMASLRCRSIGHKSHQQPPR